MHSEFSIFHSNKILIGWHDFVLRNLGGKTLYFAYLLRLASENRMPVLLYFKTVYFIIKTHNFIIKETKFLMKHKVFYYEKYTIRNTYVYFSIKDTYFSYFKNT